MVPGLLSQQVIEQSSKVCEGGIDRLIGFCPKPVAGPTETGRRRKEETTTADVFNSITEVSHRQQQNYATERIGTTRSLLF